MYAWPWAMCLMVAIQTIGTVIATNTFHDQPDYLRKAFHGDETAHYLDLALYIILGVDTAILLLTFANTHFFKVKFSGRFIRCLVGGRIGKFVQYVLALLCLVVTVTAVAIACFTLAAYLLFVVVKPLCDESLAAVETVLNAVPQANGIWSQAETEKFCASIAAVGERAFWLKFSVAIAICAFAQLNVFGVVCYNIGVLVQRRSVKKDQLLCAKRPPAPAAGAGAARAAAVPVCGPISMPLDAGKYGRDEGSCAGLVSTV